MPTHDRKAGHLVRPYCWLITALSLIVPQRLRSGWRQEWEAELRHREALLADWERLNWRTKLDLLRRSLGAFWDAFWLQPQRLEDEMFQDLRYGARMLLTSPGFAVVTILTLALGIGANTAIFSVIDAVLLRPLPFAEPERLVQIQNAHWLFNFDADSGDQFMSPIENVEVFEQAAHYDTGRVNLTDETSPERIQLMRVTAGFFPMLGVPPLLGRTFSADEHKAGNHRVVIISHGLWQSRFGGDPQVLGKTVRMNGYQHTIIGVMPRDFQFYVLGNPADAWTPLMPGVHLITTEAGAETFARLKQGISLTQAQAQMETIYQRARQQRPQFKDYDTHRIRLTPLSKTWAGNLRSPLLILLAAVGSVLLIACINAANLLLARAATRQKEVAIRAALGASRLRLVRQWLTESSLLALLGGALGLLFATWSVRVMIAISPVRVPRVGDVDIDSRALVFTLGISTLTGLLFGLAPALQFSKPALNETLKEGGRRGTADFSPRLRNALMVSEVALALVLLINAGLLVKSFRHLLDVRLGFNPKNVLTLELAPPAMKYPYYPERAEFYQQIIERIRALPGVEHVGTINDLPIAAGSLITPIQIEGRPPESQPHITAAWRVASADYFRAMQIPLLSGRYFTEQDNVSAPRVAIIDHSFARWAFPNENPIGKRLILNTGSPTAYEIVGIVGDVKHRGLDLQIDPAFYLPMRQRPSLYARLVIRTTTDPATLTSAVRKAIWEVDKDHPIYNVKTMEQHVAESISRRRFSMLMLSAFALIALLLSMVGIYGVMAFVVTQRTHEIGIRMALGARPRDVLKLVVGQGVKLITAGVALGLVGALALSRFLMSLLYEVSATDPMTFAGVALLLAVVALVACYLPARRALKVDPLVALRHE
jgi:putative ABC transport system permease protein